MKDYLAAIVRSASDPRHGRNLAREYLQARILGALQGAGAMLPLAFHGGTALRFLFGIARYSEDLYFALERPQADYDFRELLRRVSRDLASEGYQVDCKVSDRRTVHSAFVRFRGLLYELGLSPHRDEVIAVKLEVDTRPPAGAVLETTVVRRHLVLNLQHHDKASLLAGKLHALLQRPYTKGRDVYDLVWYLSGPDWPEPNLSLLNNALEQTAFDGPALSGDTWREAVRARLIDLDWKAVREDVARFLERSHELDALVLEHVLRVVS